MFFQVVEERIGVLLGKAQVRIPNKLGPAEAVRTIRVARLSGRREEEDRFRVFMLDSREFGLLRGVERLLAGRVGVQGLSDDFDRGFYGFRVSCITSSIQQVLVLLREHVHGREDQLVEGVEADVAGHVPVDELVH